MKLEWPYRIHHGIAMGHDISTDDMLKTMSNLKKQWEYACALQTELFLLKEELKNLREENAFLSEQLQEDDQDEKDRQWIKESWAGRTYRCGDTGEEFTIPDNVSERDYYVFGKCFIDVGTVRGYCRMGGNIQMLNDGRD